MNVLIFFHLLFQVRHKHTGQVMVMKEMKNCSEEAKLTFLKEVCAYMYIIQSVSPYM